MTSSSTALSIFTLDPSLTSVEFSVKHLMIATVKGRFRSFEGEILLDELEPTKSHVRVVIEAASVDTSQFVRDADLRSDNFFDIENYPAIMFDGRTVRHIEGERWEVEGDLTIKDVTRQVVLATRFDGKVQDGNGNDWMSFQAETHISRAEFGLRYNPVLEGGGVVVGDRVNIHLKVAAARKKQDDR